MYINGNDLRKLIAEILSLTPGATLNKAKFEPTCVG